MRVFVAIDLPAELLAAVARIQSEWQARLPDRLVSWTRSEQIHLTLKFIGNLPETELGELQDALRRACQDKTPLRLCAAGLGCFPDPRRPRILWVGVEGDLDALRKLQRHIKEETGAWGESEQREFHPHLTIGRVKDAGRPSSRAIKIGLDSPALTRVGQWRADEVHLVQSQLTPGGPSYKRLAAVPLSG